MKPLFEPSEKCEMTLTEEAAPLWITPIGQCEQELPEVGRYEVLQRIVTEAPNSMEAEIETCLELYVGPNGNPLWRRVVVKSGPTCPKKVIHASFQLTDADVEDTTPANGMCWAAFPEQPNHKLLCVLASPTLLCIWDVYPTGKDSNLAGEGHSIPLPFEAGGIYPLSGGKSGLLLQRVETMEDHLEGQQNAWTIPVANALQGDEDDGAFVLKAPPKPVRTSVDTLNISTTSNAIPSLFSLAHPLDDVLPISQLPLATSPVHHQQQDMVADVFEKVLFVGEVSWIDLREDYFDRRELLRPICVTYHTQRKRHAIWEIQSAPRPPQPAPLWQVSSQWRSDNGWSSHLGVFQQDLEDMELLPKSAMGFDGHLGTVNHDAATRTDALADALGIRKTPRKAAEDIGPRSRGVGARSTTRGHRQSKGSAGSANNLSLLSPLSRPTNNESTYQMEVDASIDSMAKSSLLTVGPFASLHPKLAMVCLYEDDIVSARASSVFVSSNMEGSGLLTVCMLVPDSEVPTNQKELRLLTFQPNTSSQTLSTESKIKGLCLATHFKVVPEVKIPCISAVPLEASPVPCCFHPHLKHQKNWKGTAINVLVLHSNNNLTLFRGSLAIVDCQIVDSEVIPNSIFEKDIIAIENSVGNRFDILFKSESKQYFCIRASLSLSMRSAAIGEKMLEVLETTVFSLEEYSIRTRVELALAIRSDSVRLEQALLENGEMDDTGTVSVATVLEVIFLLQLYGQNINTDKTHVAVPLMESVSPWDSLLQTKFHASFEMECKEYLFPSASIQNIRTTFMTPKMAEIAGLYARSVDLINKTGCKPAEQLFLGLHSLYEDFKLQANTRETGLQTLGTVLARLCMLPKRYPAISYLQHYRKDLGNAWFKQLCAPSISDTGSLACGNLELGEPFCILSLIDCIISGKSTSLGLNPDPAFINPACKRTRSVVRLFSRLYRHEENNTEAARLAMKRDQEIVRMLIDEGFSDLGRLKEALPSGLCVPLLEVLNRCRVSLSCSDLPGDSPNMLSLIGREDLRKNLELAQGYSEPQTPPRGVKGTSTDHIDNTKFQDQDLDGICPLELSSAMLFPDDNRIREVGRMLRSSRPVFLKVPRAIEVSDHEYERLKQEKLLLFSRRILATPLGRGMFTMGNLQPVPAEPLPLPELCLVGRVPPTNAMLALDTTECPSDLKVWPDFHNGVAAGLRLPLEEDAGELISKITRTWIVYNRPGHQQTQNSNVTNTQTNTPMNLGHAHGGLLMALGLRGHLTTLEMTDIFDYLTQGTVTTTVGVLLGMAGNMRGTCDISVSKMLCLHIPSLIPQHFSAIDVASPVQAAAVSGAGLLYQGSSHRMMTEFLLNEIGKRPSNDLSVLDREAYTLSCGIALGMVNLCKGESELRGSGNAGLADLRIEERLYTYIVGGFEDSEVRQRRDAGDRLSLPTTSALNGNEKCSRVYEGDSINTDMTGPGATLALGLIYMKTGNKSIASAIALPDTHFLLEYVRPDFLLLRVIARALILWDTVKPSGAWVDAQLPPAVKQAYGAMRLQAKCLSGETASNTNQGFDMQAVRLIYTHVIAGACFSLGLRFAGTGNREAAAAITERVMEFRDLRDGVDPVSIALRPPFQVLEMCLCCAALSLSMVLAGTGDIEALRLLKVLRWRCDEDINYGSHMAYSSAIGLLFLGGGTSTLGRSPEDIAVLIMSFYPRFPVTTSDNQYHLQALRNLYALAVQRKDVRAIDVDSGENVFVPIQICYENNLIQPVHLTTPCLIPNSNARAKELRVVSERYYPVALRLKRQVAGHRFYVKRRSAHLSYKQDPDSKRSLLVQEGSIQGENPMELLRAFTSNRVVMTFAKQFCGICDIDVVKSRFDSFSVQGFCRRVLFECLMLDTPESLSLYLELRSAVDSCQVRACTASAAAWDFRLIRSYYAQRSCLVNDDAPRVLNMELLAYLNELLEKHTHDENLSMEHRDSLQKNFFSVLYDRSFLSGAVLNESDSGGDMMDLG